MSPRLFLISAVCLFCSLFYWSYVSDRNFESYPRVDYWIQAANCAKTTGQYLVVCDAKHITPIDDISLADDRGHTLILSALAHIFQIEPSRSLLRTINLTINVLSILLLSTLLYRRSMKYSAIGLNLFGMAWAGMRAGSDVDAAYIGIGTLGVAAALLLSTPDRSLWRSIVSLLTGSILIATVVNLRQPIALGAATAAVLTSSVMLVFWNNRPFLYRVAYLCTVSIAMLGALKTPALITSIRNSWLGVKSTGITSHGIYHNLFLGLGGYVENKFGIVWDDRFAMELMKKLHPDVTYCSDDYFYKIGALYWRYIKSDPLEAVRIYLVKSIRAFSESSALTLSGFSAIAFFWALFFLSKRKPIKYSQDELTAALATALTGLSFLGQGILTHPAWTYIHPGPALLTLTVLILAVRPFGTLLPVVMQNLRSSLKR